MSLRLLKLREGELGKFPWQSTQEVWEVLTPDLRDQEYQGTHEECIQYLRNQCPNGSCEE